jgi:hypothetical protein
MPDPVKAELSDDDKAQLADLVAELEDMIRKKTGAGEKSV